MHKITSNITGLHVRFVDCRQLLLGMKFEDGGGWDYEHGFFDRTLDEQNTLFLRLPFHVKSGVLDAEQANQDTVIQFDTPFVLRHLYQDGNDETAKLRIVAAPIDQFQAPINPDAPIKNTEIDGAEKILRQTESAMKKFFN